jgi:MSHA pilin protein MshA
VLVIVIIGVLSAAALPRLSDLSNAAKIANLGFFSDAMRSTIGIIRSKAYTQGLSVTTANPGNQSAYLITTEADTSEVE